MQHEDSTTPAGPQSPADAQSAPSNVLLGRTLDKVVESQRRRLLAVAIPTALTREEIARADDVLDQLSLTFFSKPNEALANAFGAALKAVKRPSKAAFVEGGNRAFRGGLVAAAFDGQRLVLSAASPGLVLVQQGEQLFGFPRVDETDNEFLDPSETVFETRLDPGDSVALLSGGTLEDRQRPGRLTQQDVAEIAGPRGAWVWIELEAPRPLDLRQQAGLRTRSEPEAQRIWSTTAKPAEPLWSRSRSHEPAIMQRPPAIDALQRHRSASGDSFRRGVRSRLPRGRPSLAMIVAALLVLLVIGSAFGWLYTNRPQGATLPDPEVARHAAEVAAALGSDDPAAIEAVLPSAERALRIAQQTDADAGDVMLLENQILQARDRLDGVLRLQNVAMVGRLPDGLSMDQVRLAESAGVLFVLDPRIYLVDTSQMSFIQAPFSPLSSIRNFGAQTSADEAGGIVASDGSRLVLIGYDGTATEIGVSVWPKGVDPTAGIVSGFQNKLYLFDDASGEIYVASGDDNQAYRWLVDTEPPLDGGAMGLEINGAIHVVYPDGRLLSLSSGAVYNRFDLSGGSGQYEVLAIDVGEETGDLYLATTEDGEFAIEIVHLADNTVTPILLPPMTTDGHTIESFFEDIDSLVVSEARGQVFWIADGALWRGTLPEAESAS